MNLPKSILYFVILFTSCVQKKKTTPDNNYSNIISLKNLPDTLYSGEKYLGKIIYNSALDTLNLEYLENRFLYLYITEKLPINDSVFRTGEDIQTVEHEYFSSKNGDLYFEFSFKNTGNTRLSWMIEDKVFLHQKDSSMRVHTEYHSFYQNLYIKDNKYLHNKEKTKN